MTNIAIKTTLNEPFDDAVERVTKALAEEGFGILTTIDLQATMAKKLDRDMEPHTILGACNPALAWDALQAEPDTAVLLPCNVTVRQDGDALEVAAMNPEAALGLLPEGAVHRVAQEAAERLRRALDRVKASAP